MDARERYDEICDDVAARTPGAQLTQMMGMPCVKVDGKLIAGWVGSEEAMVFKLPGDAAHAAALAHDGAHLFDPGGNGRPFKEWVVVPGAHDSDWPQLARQALTLRETAT
jgi:hypothetical protein